MLGIAGPGRIDDAEAAVMPGPGCSVGDAGNSLTNASLRALTASLMGAIQIVWPDGEFVEAEFECSHEPRHQRISV